MVRQRAALLVCLTLVVAVSALDGLQTAHADGQVCPCVILIQVDGLEPKDVTPQTTPFLWALGHTNSATVPFDQSLALQSRQGFTWQAARGPMTAGTVPSTLSLLTGGYPEQSGVPADAFFDPAHPEKTYTMASTGDDTSPTPPITDRNVAKGVQLFPELFADADSNQQATVVLGDAALWPLFENETLSPVGVYPKSSADGDPHYCPPPSPGQTSQPVCPADDAWTMDKAATTLTSATGADKIAFAFIHLAGVGATKRLYGDTDAAPQSGSGDSAESTALAQSLHDMDVAVNQFVQRYTQDTGGQAKWPNTVLMIVGDHGYESTPVAQRIPDADNAADAQDPKKDLSDYASAKGFKLVPQGSFATAYYTGPATGAARQKAVEDFRTQLLADVKATQQCSQAQMPCLEDDDVLFVHHDPALTDPAAIKDEPALPSRHPDWHLDAINPATGAPSGVSGDLVIAAEPGWAIGRGVPATDAASAPATSPATNPFDGSSGGPRNRAIAAIVNGSSVSSSAAAVRGWDAPALAGGGSAFYPVGADALTTCWPAPPAATTDVGKANAAPSDDANAAGHECQAESVDFAPTMGAFMHVLVPPGQLAPGARTLQEAFINELIPVRDVQDLGQADTGDEPAPPPQDISVPPPPPPAPPPPGWDFNGLLRDVHAAVVDVRGCTWAKARRGAKLDYLRIEADFGKPVEALTLTFYRRQAANSARGRRRSNAGHARAGAAAWRFPATTAAANNCGTSAAKAAARRGSASALRLKTVAQFKPFTVARGHVVLKLLVPDQFSPDHVGMIVQQARKVRARGKDKAGKPLPNFIAFGPKAGGIFAIQGAGRLHSTKTAGGKRPAAKPRGRG